MLTKASHFPRSDALPVARAIIAARSAPRLEGARIPTGKHPGTSIANARRPMHLLRGKAKAKAKMQVKKAKMQVKKVKARAKVRHKPSGY